MGGFFAYNSETGVGFVVDDKDIAIAGGVIGAGIGIMTVWSFIMIALALVIVAPFFTLFVLDEFVEVFIVNNAVFFLAIGTVLTACKFALKTSGSLLVRILFDSYVAIFVLYIVLYLLGFDIVIYSYFKIVANYSQNQTNGLIELWGVDTVNTVTKGHWFYEFANGCVEKFIEFVKWCMLSIDNIDGSCFSVPASQINILAILKALALYVGVGGFSIITVFATVVLMFAVIVITIVLPYILALVAIVSVNKLIYKISTVKIAGITVGDAYNQAKKIHKTELDKIKNDTNYYINSKERFNIYQAAAKAGNPEAQLHCAQCYMHGEGVLEDDIKSFYWFRKAAMQGNTKAQIMTAFSYYDGYGVKKNRILAKTWLNVAMKNKEYINRNSSNKEFMIKISEISKKTRYSECF